MVKANPARKYDVVYGRDFAHPEGHIWKSTRSIRRGDLPMIGSEERAERVR